MFRAHRAHHQERHIVSIQRLVTVTLCWWPCRVQVDARLTKYKIVNKFNEMQEGSHIHNKPLY